MRSTLNVQKPSGRGSSCYQETQYRNRTDRSWQTVQTQIRQSDPGLHWLPFHLYLLDSLLYGRAIFFKSKDNYSNFSGVRIFRSFTVTVRKQSLDLNHNTQCAWQYLLNLLTLADNNLMKGCLQKESVMCMSKYRKPSILSGISHWVSFTVWCKIPQYSKQQRNSYLNLKCGFHIGSNAFCLKLWLISDVWTGTAM